MRRHRGYVPYHPWIWRQADMKEYLKVGLVVLLFMVIVMFMISAIAWLPGLLPSSWNRPHNQKPVQTHLSAFNKPLVKVEVFNQRPVDLLGRPTIFPAKENNNYAFLFRGMVGSTNFDEKGRDYLQRHPRDAVLISYTGADAEKGFLVFTNSPVPDSEYFRVARK